VTSMSPTARCSIRQGARCPPKYTAPTRGALQPAGTFCIKMISGEALWVWSWSSVRKPDRRSPLVSRLIVRALRAARCFSRAPAARFAAPITPGLRGKPGSTSQAAGSGTGKVPWHKRRYRSGDDRDWGTPWRTCTSRLKHPPGCSRPGTFFTKHDGSSRALSAMTCARRRRCCEKSQDLRRHPIRIGG
jgi:hypothetical protein